MSVLGLSSVFDGFAWVEGMREWRVEGTLEAKLGRWHEEGLSGDVGLMILWLFDGEDEDADGLSEESEEDKEMPAISCFRSACTRSGIQTALAPIPFPEACVDLTYNQGNASFSRTRLLASTHPCNQTGLPS
jgi:hypothetical protein